MTAFRAMPRPRKAGPIPTATRRLEEAPARSSTSTPRSRRSRRAVIRSSRSTPRSTKKHQEAPRSIKKKELVGNAKNNGVVSRGPRGSRSRRKSETTGNTNVDLDQCAGPRPYRKAGRGNGTSRPRSRAGLGGSPTGLQWRNVIMRTAGAIATRYDRLAETFLAAVALVCILFCLN